MVATNECWYGSNHWPPRKNDILFWIGENFLVKLEGNELPFRQEKTRKWHAQILANAIKIQATDGKPFAIMGMGLPWIPSFKNHQGLRTTYWISQIIKTRRNQIWKRCGHFEKMLPVTKRLSMSRCVVYVLGSSHENWHSPLFKQKTTHLSYKLRHRYDT